MAIPEKIENQESSEATIPASNATTLIQGNFPKKNLPYFVRDNSLIYLFVIMFFLSFLLFLSACNKKSEVVGVTQNQNLDSRVTEHFNESGCSESTIIRPKVDFLFLWDNSSSFNYINKDTKNSLRSTINQFSTRFDYHVVLAPLVIDESNPKNNPPLFLMLDNTTGIHPDIIKNSDPNVKIIANDSTSRMDIFNSIPNSRGAKEHGLRRIVSIINDTNIQNGLFRKNAYTIIVIISGGNVNDFPGIVTSVIDSGTRKTMETEYANLLKEIGTVKLTSEQFRLISIVPASSSIDYSTSCPKVGIEKGVSYINVSESIYANLPSAAKDAQSDQNKDHYDLCKNNFSHIFDGVNQTIQDILIKHVYNFWRIATTTNKAFDPKKITVTKSTGLSLIQDDSNGFRYIGFKENQPTRKLPTVGDVRTGHFIELFGNGVVTYPECLRIETQEPADYYNYIVLNEKPNVDTIEIEINGKKIPKGQSDGWWYEDYSISKNIKVESPSNPVPIEPGEFKSGYMIRLNGSAVYTNSSKIKYSYKRAAID
ncbi:MAG: hypothetical protein HQK49_07115 [Oligoflexia bacterium]|nr:hypothetical protein [Oligoflexia bacterium]